MEELEGVFGGDFNLLESLEEELGEAIPGEIKELLGPVMEFLGGEKDTVLYDSEDSIDSEEEGAIST